MPIAIELDYYPLTIIPSYGIIAGLDSQILNQKSSGFSLFKVKSQVLPVVSRLTCDKNQLFIHRILHRLLEFNDVDQAIEFASSFSHLDFFTHILELLLHDTLEREADNVPPEEGL